MTLKSNIGIFASSNNNANRAGLKAYEKGETGFNVSLNSLSVSAGQTSELQTQIPMQQMQAGMQLNDMQASMQLSGTQESIQLDVKQLEMLSMEQFGQNTTLLRAKPSVTFAENAVTDEEYNAVSVDYTYTATDIDDSVTYDNSSLPDGVTMYIYRCLIEFLPVEDVKSITFTDYATLKLVNAVQSSQIGDETAAGKYFYALSTSSSESPVNHANASTAVTQELGTSIALHDVTDAKFIDMRWSYPILAGTSTTDTLQAISVGDIVTVNPDTSNDIYPSTKLYAVYPDEEVRVYTTTSQDSTVTINYIYVSTNAMIGIRGGSLVIDVDGVAYLPYMDYFLNMHQKNITDILSVTEIRFSPRSYTYKLICMIKDDEYSDPNTIIGTTYYQDTIILSGTKIRDIGICSSMNIADIFFVTAYSLNSSKQRTIYTVSNNVGAVSGKYFSIKHYGTDGAIHADMNYPQYNVAPNKVFSKILAVHKLALNAFASVAYIGNYVSQAYTVPVSLFPATNYMSVHPEHGTAFVSVVTLPTWSEDINDISTLPPRLVDEFPEVYYKFPVMDYSISLGKTLFAVYRGSVYDSQLYSYANTNKRYDMPSGDVYASSSLFVVATATLTYMYGFNELGFQLLTTIEDKILCDSLQLSSGVYLLGTRGLYIYDGKVVHRLLSLTATDGRFTVNSDGSMLACIISGNAFSLVAVNQLGHVSTVEDNIVGSSFFFLSKKPHDKCVFSYTNNSATHIAELTKTSTRSALSRLTVSPLIAQYNSELVSLSVYAKGVGTIVISGLTDNTIIIDIDSVQYSKYNASIDNREIVNDKAYTIHISSNVTMLQSLMASVVIESNVDM